MKYLIPALLLFSSFHLSAQKPTAIQTGKPATGPVASQESCSNFAGTVMESTFIGQSNDHDLNTVFLCYKDSLLIHHLGDANLSGDPQPGTTPGVAYAFYTCPPTVTGPTLQDIASIPGPGDPCLLTGAPTGLYVTPGIPNGGDTWFFNSGDLQNAFNIGQPMSLHFAPITLDDYANTAYEAPFIGAPPGPCVHANKNAAFEVVYLNEIKANNVSSNFGNDCIGRFTGFGGYPQYDGQAIYQVEVSLNSHPDTKAQVMVAAQNIFHLASIPFSAPEPGVYDVVIKDGKSCNKQFQVNMAGCDASDNVTLDAAEVAGAPGETACVPVYTTNFEVQSGSFSLSWDPSRLQYTGLSNFHPSIAGFFNPGTSVNSSSAGSGKLGVQIYNTNAPGTVINIPDGEALFDICFMVLDTSGAPCSTVDINNELIDIAIENVIGQSLAVTTIPGGVCQSVGLKEPVAGPVFRISPNPIRKNTPEIIIWAEQTTQAQARLFNTLGANILSQEMELQPGANRFEIPGIYLPAGLYYLQLLMPDGNTQTFQLVSE